MREELKKKLEAYLDTRDIIVYTVMAIILLYIWIFSRSPELDDKIIYTLILGIYADQRVKSSDNSKDIELLKKQRTETLEGIEKIKEETKKIPVIKNDINWIKEKLKSL